MRSRGVVEGVPVDAQREARRLTALAVGLAYSDLDDAACVARIRRAARSQALVGAARHELVRWSLLDTHEEARALRLLLAAATMGADLPSGLP